MTWVVIALVLVLASGSWRLPPWPRLVEAVVVQPWFRPLNRWLRARSPRYRRWYWLLCMRRLTRALQVAAEKLGNALSPAVREAAASMARFGEAMGARGVDAVASMPSSLPVPSDVIPPLYPDKR
jgi:hypothetical protein